MYTYGIKQHNHTMKLKKGLDGQGSATKYCNRSRSLNIINRKLMVAKIQRTPTQGGIRSSEDAQAILAKAEPEIGCAPKSTRTEYRLHNTHEEEGTLGNSENSNNVNVLASQVTKDSFAETGGHKSESGGGPGRAMQRTGRRAEASRIKKPPLVRPANRQAKVTRARAHGMTIQREGKEFGYYTKGGKKKSRRAILMEEFGGEHRRIQVDPNKVIAPLEVSVDPRTHELMKVEEDKKAGIWLPSAKEGTARPEDPPLYPKYREKYHEAQGVYLALRQAPGTVDTSMIDALGKAVTEIASKVKVASKDYKDAFRKTNADTKENLVSLYFNAIDALLPKLEGALTAVIDDMKTKYTIPPDELEDMKKVKARQGEDIWRRQWYAAVQAVNLILKDEWKKAIPRIGTWMKALQKKHSSYMNPDMIGELTYIGSLAKGYKGPPKQYIRFTPEKFDVDANLDAPPLAIYAIAEKNQTPDRGSVKAEAIKPLKDFQKTMNGKLKSVPGYDEKENFEVFLKTEGVGDFLPGAKQDDPVRKAQTEQDQAKRFQQIQDKIWKLKVNTPAVWGQLEGLLSAYSKDNILMARQTGAAPTDTTRKYEEADLTKLEARLAKLEAPEEPGV